MSRFSGLRGRLTALAVVPALVAVLLIAASSYSALLAVKQDRQQAELAAASQRLSSALADISRQMHGYAGSLASRPTVVQALALGDAPAAQRLMAETFAAIRAADPTVEVIEATDARGRVLARGHRPERFGDDKSGVPDVAMALAGRPGLGNVMSPASNELAIGATLPVMQEGRVVGTVKAGTRLSASTATMLGELAGGEALLFVNGVLLGSTVPGLTVQSLPPALLAAAREGGSSVPLLVQLGDKGTHTALVVAVKDFQGRPAGAAVLAVPDLPWAMARTAAMLRMLAVAAVVLAVTVLAGLLIAARIARPMVGMAVAMGDIAQERENVAIPGAGRRDEIGRMAGALAKLAEAASEKRRLEAQAAEERAIQLRRAAAMERHTADFGRSIGGVLGSLGEAASAMRETAGGMAASAQQTEAEAARTAQAADSAAGDLGTVAAAAEELASSVSEISRQVATAAMVARETVDQATATDQRMQALTVTADRIGGIVRLISDVAGRTNLLALNATIEAARAGEAGKGFAVVAGEVKQLATQTAKATEEIAAQITAMESATRGAADAMQGVVASIRRMDEVAATIAAAVEEQGVATQEINQRVQSVSSSTPVVTGAMEELSSIARNSGTDSRAVLGAAEGLAAQTVTLRQEVDGFLAAIRGDTGERRRFERLPAQGSRVGLVLPGRAEQAVELVDVSAGGAALRCAVDLAPGTEVSVTLAPGQKPEAARVVRAEGGVLALVFRTAPSMAAEPLLDRLRGAKRAA
ncbi:methyl-accepting chemotaxis protein [Falsiroseomonas stagni]|uniref:methyl-accepting chemotaxis protein n=1 Tax=Falsiroseomonas stagni TaxID=484882 RepID=UPI001FEC11D3|nr:methyl-accepting chemotaxis protein [Falsiroseomonas stagni]